MRQSRARSGKKGSGGDSPGALSCKPRWMGLPYCARASRRRPTRVAAAAPNRSSIGGAGTSVGGPPELLVEEVEVDPPVEVELEVEELVDVDEEVLVEVEEDVLVELEVETLPDEVDVELDVETLPDEVLTLPELVEVEVEMLPEEVEVELPPVLVLVDPPDVEVEPPEVEVEPVLVEVMTT